jgi:hypothetical protein
MGEGRPSPKVSSPPREARLGLARSGGTGGTAQQRMDAMDFFRCHDCGQIIGVYEPIVAYDGSGARTTSRAAEPDLRASAAAYYHRSCYAAIEQPEPQTASGA